MNLKNKNVLVYGLGRSGRAAAELLKRREANVFIYDDGVVENIPSGVTVISDLVKGIEMSDLAVLSPSVDLSRPVIADAVRTGKAVGELEFAYRFLDSELIAVSGTNGKTTVTLLINEIINKAGYISYALGNIGIPLSEKVLDMTPSETAVVEVSTFQLESAREFSPDIAVLTNVTSDHIDRHKTRENYIALKAKLFEKQINRDVAVINADDKTSMEIAENLKSDVFYFSATRPVRGAYVERGEIYFEDKSKIHIGSVSEVRLKGAFNLQNSLAAAAACMAKGVNSEIIRIVLKSFDAPEYRCTYIGEKRGKRFYNDSKATNIAATLASAEAMDGRTVLIIGGDSKGENYDNLFKNGLKNVIHVFVTGGNSAELVESALKNGFYNISHRATLAECVRESASVRAENVLFAPASASFDRYRDYRERGKIFTEIVGALR